MKVNGTTAIGLKPRNQQIDAMKFLLILSIFIFHFETAAGNFYPFANTFQVEAFFAISGFWALNKLKKPFLSSTFNSFKNYFIPWLIWVVIYTLYYTFSLSLGIRMMSDTFVKYFSAVRGTGIWGMWFTPLFFIITVFYTFISKIFAKLFKVSDKILALIMFLFSFSIFFICQYVVRIPADLFFSIHLMPTYLLYFALGTFLYNWTCIFDCGKKASPAKKIIYPVISVASVLYLGIGYFQKTDILWGWTSDFLGGKLTFIPQILIVLAALFSFNFMAKYISCDFTSKIGRKTLGLCHGEAFIKSVITLAASLVGLQLKAKTPIEVIIMSFSALILGGFIIVPAVNKFTDRLLMKNKS